MTKPVARFIAIVWNERADHARADAAALIEKAETARPHWKRSLDLPGLVAFEPPPRTRAEEGFDFAGGRLIGAAFVAGAHARFKASAFPIDAVRASDGALLFASAWGRYVAVWKDEPNACAFVARDASGAMGCFMAAHGWAHAFFSHAEDIDAIALGEAKLDWSYLAGRLVNNRIISAGTGFAEVEELAPGAVARIGQGRRSIRQIWTPEAIAAKADDRREPDAAALLKESVRAAARAWAAQFDRIALRLSGGLDSSIVAAALSGAPCKVRAVNFVTPTPEGDERVFARAAARRAGFELEEIHRDPWRVSLAEAARIGPGVRPPLWLADGETDKAEADLARRGEIEAFFSGRGGDNVFFRSEGAEALADLWQAHGLKPRLLSAAWRHARARGRPLLSIARELMNADRGRVRPGRTPGLLSEKALALAPSPPAPSLDLPLGKQLHVAMIQDRLNYFDWRAHADYVYPLVSQPVLEAVLALPTYVLSPGGADRGLARAAFSGEIAPDVLARRSKGQTTGYLTQILIGNLEFLRAFLLDGVLAGEGMLALDALSGLLSEGGLIKAPDRLAALMGVFSVEAWLRSVDAKSF